MAIADPPIRSSTLPKFGTLSARNRTNTITDVRMAGLFQVNLCGIFMNDSISCSGAVAQSRNAKSRCEAIRISVTSLFGPCGRLRITLSLVFAPNARNPITAVGAYRRMLGVDGDNRLARRFKSVRTPSLGEQANLLTA